MSLRWSAPDAAVLHLGGHGNPSPALFKTRIAPNYGQEQYAVAADGQRFLLMDPIRDERTLGLRVIVDWPALIK